MNRRYSLSITMLVVLAACGGTEGTPPSTSVLPVETTHAVVSATSTEPGPLPTTTVPGPLAHARSPEQVVEVPDAVVIGVAVNGRDEPVVAWISDADVAVARLGADGTLTEAARVNGDIAPFAHPIERPAVALRDDGSIDVAFTALVGAGGSVFHARLTADDVEGPSLISGEPRPETNLVHVTLDANGEPVFSWLEDLTLSVAVSAAGDVVETELVDDLTCDCCNPVPQFVEDSLVVAYRDLERTGGDVIRNVASVRSTDGGATFAETVPIADGDWFIDACPFTGPSTVTVRGDLIVAWMDARQSVHPDQRTTSIWVDISRDGGQTWGIDLQVTGDGINRWPVLAVDDAGTIHLVWERQGGNGGLLHAASTDGGQTFTTARVLAARDGNAGPRTPSVAYDRGSLIVTWAAGSTGFVGVWDAEELAASG